MHSNNNQQQPTGSIAQGTTPNQSSGGSQGSGLAQGVGAGGGVGLNLSASGSASTNNSNYSQLNAASLQQLIRTGSASGSSINLSSDPALLSYQKDVSEQSNDKRRQQKIQESIAEMERAAKNCHYDLLQQVIEDVVEDSIPQRDLNRALLQAVQSCSSNKKSELIDCITCLLGAGANVNAQDPTDGRSALMIACEKGYIEVVHALIQQEAQVNMKDKKSRSPIMYAIDANAENSDVVMQLINKGADVNLPSMDGWSPLLKATSKSYHEIMSKLIDRNANLTQKVLQNNNTALHIACERGDLQAVGMIVQAAKIFGNLQDVLEMTNKEKETPFMIAERNQAKSQEYSQTFNHLKHVIEEREASANKVNEELVKQETIKQQRENKKQQNKQQQKQGQNKGNNQQNAQSVKNQVQTAQGQTPANAASLSGIEDQNKNATPTKTQKNLPTEEGQIAQQLSGQKSQVDMSQLALKQQQEMMAQISNMQMSQEEMQKFIQNQLHLQQQYHQLQQQQNQLVAQGQMPLLTPEQQQRLMGSGSKTHREIGLQDSKQIDLAQNEMNTQLNQSSSNVNSTGNAIGGNLNNSQIAQQQQIYDSNSQVFQNQSPKKQEGSGEAQKQYVTANYNDLTQFPYTKRHPMVPPQNNNKAQNQQNKKNPYQQQIQNSRSNQQTQQLPSSNSISQQSQIAQPQQSYQTIMGYPFPINMNPAQDPQMQIQQNQPSQQAIQQLQQQQQQQQRMDQFLGTGNLPSGQSQANSRPQSSTQVHQNQALQQPQQMQQHAQHSHQKNSHSLSNPGANNQTLQKQSPQNKPQNNTNTQQMNQHQYPNQAQQQMQHQYNQQAHISGYPNQRSDSNSFVSTNNNNNNHSSNQAQQQNQQAQGNQNQKRDGPNQNFKKNQQNQALPYQTHNQAATHSPQMQGQRYQNNPVINISQPNQLQSNQVLGQMPMQGPYLPIGGMIPGQILANPPQNQALAAITHPQHHQSAIQANAISQAPQQVSQPLINLTHGTQNPQNAGHHHPKPQNNAQQQQQLGGANNISIQNIPTNMLPTQQQHHQPSTHSMIFPNPNNLLNVQNQASNTSSIPNQIHQNQANLQSQLGIITQQTVQSLAQNQNLNASQNFQVNPQTSASQQQQQYSQFLQQSNAQQTQQLNPGAPFTIPLNMLMNTNLQGGLASGLLHGQQALTGNQSMSNLPNQSANANSGSIRQVTQQPTNKKVLPIQDQLDLSSEEQIKLFIANMKRMQAEKNLLKEQQKVKNLDEQLRQQLRLIEEKDQKLVKADGEIFFYQQALQKQKMDLDQITFEKGLQDMAVNTHQQDKQRLELELNACKGNMEKVTKVAMTLITQQKSFLEKVQISFDKKAPVEEKDLGDAQKNLEDQQEQLNSFIKNERNQNAYIMPNLGGQGAPSAQSDKPERKNMLIKSIDKYESFQFCTQDTQDLHNRLHHEIISFKDSVGEILAELQPLKEQLIQNIAQVIKRALANSEVQVYGSHATKLCLPWSDIDLVVKNGSAEHYTQTPKHCLSIISRELLNEQQQQQWIKEVKFVESATVPVVKVKCQVDQIINASGKATPLIMKFKNYFEDAFSIDITQLTENHNGLECVKLVQDFLKENEVIEPLILVLKQYLKVCQFNDPYYGGISSYALFLLLVSFLQSRQIPKYINQVNLGTLLLSFYQYYGELQFQSTGIYTCPIGKSPEKPNHYSIVNALQLFAQTVQIDDPLNPHNNVGKSSFKFADIKESFKFTHMAAYAGCFCENTQEEKDRQKVTYQDSHLNTNATAFNRPFNQYSNVASSGPQQLAQQLATTLSSLTTSNYGNYDQVSGSMPQVHQSQYPAPYGEEILSKEQAANRLACLGQCDSILSKIFYSFQQFQMHMYHHLD